MVSTSQAEGLLVRIADGDRSAFNDCVQLHGKLVWGIVSKFFPHRHDREDISQDVFLSLWKYADRFDPQQGSEATFVAVIARRRVVDHLRRRERDLSTTSSGDEGFDPESPDAPQREIESQDEAGHVIKAMKQLREEERQVLQLGILQGLSHAQISKQLEIPLGTVKSLARRGMMRLRELVQQSNPVVQEAT